MPTKSAQEQAAYARSAAELQRRVLERVALPREQARQRAEASRPPTMGEVIYGRGQQYDGKAARLRSIAAGFAKCGKRR
jgi:hypothetical protein